MVKQSFYILLSNPSKADLSNVQIVAQKLQILRMVLVLAAERSLPVPNSHQLKVIETVEYAFAVVAACRRASHCFTFKACGPFGFNLTLHRPGVSLWIAPGNLRGMCTPYICLKNYRWIQHATSADSKISVAQASPTEIRLKRAEFADRVCVSLSRELCRSAAA